ncbi:MAG: DUF3160 domain-containing protein [Chloroflexi bacterium]|nr:DUF3160 domain-containing protein [Chloroflexota bacterium]
MKRLHLIVPLVVLLLSLALPAAAQDETPICNPQLPPRLDYGVAGLVTRTDNPTPVRVREQPSTGAPVAAMLDEGSRFIVIGYLPTCADGITWWQITTGDTPYASGEGIIEGYVAEGVEETYFIEPYTPALALPAGQIPVAGPPQITPFSNPLPTVPPVSAMPILQDSFAQWTWPPETYIDDFETPDPLKLTLPVAYAGNMPSLPIDLSQVAYLDGAGLSPAQLGALSRNGFVVVPAGRSWPEQSLWQDNATGRSNYISTDMMLSNLYYIYRYTLMYLETSTFYNQLATIASQGFLQAQAQWQTARDTPLEEAARNAALYYAVMLMLLNDGEEALFGDTLTAEFYRDFISVFPSETLAAADPELLTLAHPIAAGIRAAKGSAPIPFLENYDEDFGLYAPRSHYENDALLGSYFRAITWLGRITFRLDSAADTLAGLLVLRAMAGSEAALTAWTNFNDTIEFLIGPSDNLRPTDLLPIARPLYGDDLPLEALGDSATLEAFRAAARELPPPRINSLQLDAGTSAEDMREAGRGFRLFGGRYTLDAEYFQRLMDPDVPGRALPTGLDLAAAFGSDAAYALLEEAGLTSFADYIPALSALREQTASIAPDSWMENAYGSWLWALQPLLNNDPALEPPLMATDAWQRREISTGAGQLDGPQERDRGLYAAARRPGWGRRNGGTDHLHHVRA